MYDYFEVMKNDVESYILENVGLENLKEELPLNFDGVYDRLYTEMWVADSVTGNASGSYTFNRNLAREYVIDNMYLLNKALTEFCEPANLIVEKLLGENWEYFDVTIRCYMLGQALTEVLEELEKELEV